MPSARAPGKRTWNEPSAAVRTPLTRVVTPAGPTSCRSTETPGSVRPIRLGWRTLVTLSPAMPESSRGDSARLGTISGPCRSIVRVKLGLEALMLPAWSTVRVRTVKVLMVTTVTLSVTV